MNDGLVDSDEVTINIEVNGNKPPVLSFLLGSTGEQRLKPGERLDIRVNAADAEGQMVIVNYEGQLPEGATFSKESRSGVFSWKTAS